MERKIDCAYDSMVPVHKLVPHPDNNNTHPDEQIERLAKIIDYQGMRSPIVVSKRSGFITKGHGRLEALKKLGWESVPVNYQSYENEAQEYADITADNEVARWAKLDTEKVTDKLSELDIDLDLLGIESFKIEIPEMEDTGLEDLSSENRVWSIEVKFPNEMEMRDIHDDLESRGYTVKVLGE